MQKLIRVISTKPVQPLEEGQRENYQVQKTRASVHLPAMDGPASG